MFSRQALLRSARVAAPQRAFLGQTRTFAAPAASDKVKPPVTLFGLDGTYATALVCARPPLNWIYRRPMGLVNGWMAGWIGLGGSIGSTGKRAKGIIATSD